jgi:hypothetical protein
MDGGSVLWQYAPNAPMLRRTVFGVLLLLLAAIAAVVLFVYQQKRTVWTAFTFPPAAAHPVRTRHKTLDECTAAIKQRGGQGICGRNCGSGIECDSIVPVE